ncbi:MAG: hypothetical protein P9M08_01195 [Candidatus Erginobacter occultus]|nr:hypothetical protein [Candidatus Erginobacter occultus]
MRISPLFLAGFLLAGCAGTRPAGRARLDALRGGMTMAEVVEELGEPTARIEMRVPGRVYYDLSYVDTIVEPGVVELYFRPTLSEIVIDAEPYREY